MASTIAPLIVITGPTGSGKTDVAIRLAREFNGEIVCADSRTVYKGLDIGTAKPTRAERALVPHHLLDVVAPDEPYDLARFQREATTAIDDIRRRGKVPFLVGGSGLYIDSIVLRYQLDTPPNPELRRELEALPIDALLQYGKDHNIELPHNLYNKRYVIRAIEQNGVNRSKADAPEGSTIVVGITTDVETLKARLHLRAHTMFNSGVIDEAQQAADHYGWDCAPLRSPAYKACRRLINGEIDNERAIESLARDDWQLARKQMTWMRRNTWINWKPLDEVESYVRSILTQSQS